MNTANTSTIIGVALLAEGGNGGTWAHIDETGETFVPSDDFFNAHPVWSAIEDVTIDGQSMVKIPAFYVKRAIISGGSNNGKEGWWISDTPAPGFHIHPAFRDNGSDIGQVYVGKYQASLENDKLASVPGVLPTVNRSLTQFQAHAAARNTGGQNGFMLWSFYQLAAIQWLYLVENATMNCQTCTGNGRVTANTAANVDAADVAQASYRGVVGLWGNIWQWVDGVRTKDKSIDLWDIDGHKTWTRTGLMKTKRTQTIMPLTIMGQSGPGFNLGDVFIGDGNARRTKLATIPDYQTMEEYNERYFCMGGTWGTGETGGLWYFKGTLVPFSNHRALGARLAKI
ncbi:MAG: hypothetical protein ACNI3A_12105 [Desulfovibrio sp.]|uniref:hypothetical protein n=1 Tax=Desulfovibrio sp. 7SRBS1 TaxID=3378064 RepID=UPI003B4030DC